MAKNIVQDKDDDDEDVATPSEDISSDTTPDTGEDTDNNFAAIAEKANPKATLARIQNLKLNPTQNSTPINNIFAKLLGTSDPQLQAAQDQRKQIQLLTGLGQAGSTIGQALTPLAPKEDYSPFWKEMQTQAQQPITDLTNQQQLAAQKLKTYQLGNQLSPDSPEADSMRSLILQDAKSLGIKLDEEDLKKNSLGTLINIKKDLNTRATRQMMSRYHNALLSDSRDQKATDKQNQAVTQTNQMLESARGNPSVQQAEKDLYSAKKAIRLINQFDNPDNMSPQQVHLLVAEVSKIATGGVPAQAELQAGMPDTVKQHLASFWSKLSNEPTPANAGEFVKQYKNYLNGMSEDALDILHNKVGRVLDTRKKLIGEDHYTNFQQNYLKPYEDIAASLKSKSTLQQSNKVNIKDPQGNIRSIPKDQIDAAIKAGGQLVQ